jgi:sigma-B regulation protein RsbU (phosphoserine phosphatase)
MRHRDALLFAATGWDPTWQRRLSAPARAVWASAVGVLSTIFCAALLLAWLRQPPDERWTVYVLAACWLVAVAVVQVLVRREVLRRIDIEGDQIAAREIQARLLPAELPAAPGFEVAARYSPFREIGGDFYDVAVLDDGRWLVVMADVSGKGTSAALLTASLQALVRFAFVVEPTLEAATAAINAHLARFAPPGRFVTMVLGVLDLERRRLRYVNAGHNPPLGVTPGGDVLRLGATGLPLGVFESAGYTAAEVELPPGTTLLFYTDGLVERPNGADEFLGEEPVIDALRGSPGGTSAAEVLAALGAVADRFAQGVEPADDVALLVVRSR